MLNSPACGLLCETDPSNRFPTDKISLYSSITFASLSCFSLARGLYAELISRKICIRPTPLTNSPWWRPCFILSWGVITAIFLFSFEPYSFCTSGIYMLSLPHKVSHLFYGFRTDWLYLLQWGKILAPRKRCPEDDT